MNFKEKMKSKFVLESNFFYAHHKEYVTAKEQYDIIY